MLNCGEGSVGPPSQGCLDQRGHPNSPSFKQAAALQHLSSQTPGHGAAFLYYAELEEAAGLTFQEIKAGGLSSPNSLHGPQPRTAG